MSIDTEFFGGQPPKWVSGTTYALDFVVRSPTSQLYYVRIVAGAGTTDPSSDTTNWALTGGSRIKSIQSGEIEIPLNTATATATISSVVTSANKTFLTKLGEYATSSPMDPAQMSAVIELTNSTTITARRLASGQPIRVRYQVTEMW